MKRPLTVSQEPSRIIRPSDPAFQLGQYHHGKRVGARQRLQFCHIMSPPGEVRHGEAEGQFVTQCATLKGRGVGANVAIQQYGAEQYRVVRVPWGSASGFCRAARKTRMTRFEPILSGRDG